MKKFFVIAAALVMAANIYYWATYKGDTRTPLYEFKNQVGVAELATYRDGEFGYTIYYPEMFEQDEKCQRGARFVFHGEKNIVLETYVAGNHSSTLEACADSLAKASRSAVAMVASGRKGQYSAFTLSGPVYENGVRLDGYSHYGKFIKSGKMLFVYSCTYPDSYKLAMTRIFRLIDNWQVMGAY